MKAKMLKDLIQEVIDNDNHDTPYFIIYFMLFRKYIPEDEVHKLKEENEKLKEIVKKYKGCMSCKYRDVSENIEPCKTCYDNSSDLPHWEYKNE